MSRTAYDEWLGRSTRPRTTPRGTHPTGHRRTRLVRGAAVIVCVAISSILTGGTASATWSIVGTDPATGQVGAAVASCTDTTDLTATMALVPKVGGAVSVGQAPGSSPVHLASALRAGQAPAEVLTTVASPSIDSGTAVRQYGVAALEGGARTATGASTPGPHGSAISRDGTAAMQGNLVASPAVITSATAAYDSTTGPLAARLLAALKAGSAAGGDRSCGATPKAAAVVVVGSQSALFVPAATPEPGGSQQLIESGELTPAQLAEQLRQQSLRPIPRGPRAPDLYVSVIAGPGGNALTTAEARYEAIAAADASRAEAALAEQVIDPAYSEGLTIAAIVLFLVLGLILAALIIAGLRRADRRAAEQRAMSEDDDPSVRLPYRGEVAHLFDVDLTAAARRRRREAQGRPARPSDRSRESMWSSSSW